MGSALTRLPSTDDDAAACVVVFVMLVFCAGSATTPDSEAALLTRTHTLFAWRAMAPTDLYPGNGSLYLLLL